MRSIALDVHRDFCEVAIKDGGEVRSAGRVKTSRAELELFAQSLAPTDQVALEATGPALQIKRLIEPHVGRVVIANTRKLRAIAEAKVKTDKVDARTLCELLAAGFLPEVFDPDEETRALRRRLARRAALVRQRTRAKNELHAALHRNLKGRPPVSDVFGVRGRQWLEALELPADERETVAGCLRQVDFLDREVSEVERGAGAIGTRIRSDPAADQRPGREPRLGGHLRRGGRRGGPLPHPRQAGLLRGARPPGSPVRRGPGAPRPDLQAGLAGGPPRALRGGLDRGPHPGAVARLLRAPAGSARGSDALVATARKLCVLFWHLLAKEEDYAFGRPSLHRHKLRRLELVAGDPSRRGRRSGSGASKREQAHERELSEQFEAAYRRLVDDWQQVPKKTGAGATPGRASRGPSSGQAARQGSAPEPAL